MAKKRKHKKKKNVARNPVAKYLRRFNKVYKENNKRKYKRQRKVDHDE